MTFWNSSKSFKLISKHWCDICPLYLYIFSLQMELFD